MRPFGSACCPVALAAFAIACNASPTPNPPAVTAAVVTSAHPRSASPEQSPACPAPKVSQDACAAVMTYVQVGGVCCAYGDPCSAPPGKAYDDDRCTRPR